MFINKTHNLCLLSYLIYNLLNFYINTVVHLIEIIDFAFY